MTNYNHSQFINNPNIEQHKIKYPYIKMQKLKKYIQKLSIPKSHNFSTQHSSLSHIHPYRLAGIPAQQLNNYQQLPISDTNIDALSFLGNIPQFLSQTYMQILLQFVNGSGINHVNSYGGGDGGGRALFQDCFFKRWNVEGGEGGDGGYRFSLVGEGSEIQWRLIGLKLIVGVGNDRSLWPKSLLKLAHFPDTNLTLYFAQSNHPSPTSLQCLIQAEILYKSSLKLIPSQLLSISQTNNEQQNNQQQQQQQNHIVQYEAQGCFDPQLIDLDKQIKQFKSSISLFSSSSNRKLIATYLGKVFGVNQIGKFQVSDFDGFMDGRRGSRERME